ncbi:MAG: hypothetical protein PS018_09210 [bacterium]|nr:hypothetical protein [bacterium]
MRKLILALAVLVPAAAFAQTSPPPAASAPPPTVGGKPLVQVGSKKPPKESAAPKEAAAPKPAAGKKGPPARPLSIAQRLQACQDHDDLTKERLVCYDAVYPPQPKPKPAAAKAASECRFVKEEDERVTCYNKFVDKLPILPR